MARKEFEYLTIQMFYILLALYDERCGYDIMNQVKVLSDGKVVVGAGTLYALLPKFENAGFIKNSRSLDNKKFYVITDAGKEKLKAQVESYQVQIDLYHKENPLI